MTTNTASRIDSRLLLELWKRQTAEALRVRSRERLQLVNECIEAAAPTLDGRARVRALALVARVQAGLRYLDAA